MNVEKMKNEESVSPVDSVVTSASASALDKCYAYASTSRDLCVMFPDEYRAIYEKVTQTIEQMDCAENVRTVMRLRYRYGHQFVDISRLLGVTYQWVYELHKNGVGFLEKLLSF